MTDEIGIVKGDWGKAYRFVIKNVNYSGYGAKVYVQWSGSGRLLISGDACSVTATDNQRNTLVTYTPVSGRFGANASLTAYSARIRFSGASLRDSTERFVWRVEEEFTHNRTP